MGEVLKDLERKVLATLGKRKNSATYNEILKKTAKRALKKLPIAGFRPYPKTLADPELLKHAKTQYAAERKSSHIPCCGRVWLAQLVRSLPSNHKVPSSIPGSVKI